MPRMNTADIFERLVADITEMSEYNRARKKMLPPPQLPPEEDDDLDQDSRWYTKIPLRRSSEASRR